MRALSSSSPCSRTATVGTTGTPPSPSESRFRSIFSPRDSAMSIMFSATITGRPISMIWTVR